MVFVITNKVKEQEIKFLLSLAEIPVSNFIAIKQAKGQGTNALSRHRNLPFGFEVRNGVKEPEKKFLLSHENLPFWFLKS